MNQVKADGKIYSAWGNWAFGLSIFSLVWCVILINLWWVVALIVDTQSSEALISPALGLTLLVVEIISLVAAITINIIVFRHGARQTKFLVGFAISIILGAFWLIFLIGELVFPH